MKKPSSHNPTQKKLEPTPQCVTLGGRIVMPYFLTHYFDVKGCCNNRHYWTFLIIYKLTAIILSVPLLHYLMNDMLRDEAVLDYLYQVIDQASSSAPDINQTIEAGIPLITTAMSESLSNILHADSLTTSCLILFTLWSSLLFPPFISLTICRLRDAKTSQLSWLLLLPSTLQPLALWAHCPSPLQSILNSSLFSCLSSIAVILFFALLCKGSARPITDHDPEHCP